MRKLLKLGLPMVYEITNNNTVILVRRGVIASTLAVRALRDPYTGEVSGVALEPLGSGVSVKVGEVYNGGLKVDLTRVIIALRSSELLSPFEADLWTLRLSHINSLRELVEVPETLKRLKANGFKISVLEDTCDLAVGVEDVIGLWMNYCTGRVDIALDEQEALGVYSWGPLKEVVKSWLEELRQ